MKRYILVVLLCAIALANRSHAANCKMVAVHDTYAEGATNVLMKQGAVSYDVTQYVVNHKTGEKTFCIHGGYCYVINVIVGGRSVDALKLTNCRVKFSSRDDDGDTLMYELEPISARIAAPPVQSEQVTDVRGIGGSCQIGSQTVSGLEQEDIKGHEVDFYCDAVAISFMDHVNKRLTIRFFDSKHIKDGERLGFAGEMQGDGKTLTVENIEFIDPKSSAAPAGKDSFCALEFSDTSLRGIQCFAFTQAGGYKHLALINFVADRG